jgi:hypothetical protein
MTASWEFNATIVTLLFGVAALALAGIATWLFADKAAREAKLEELRLLLAKTAPTDPEYNQVRALYVATMNEAKGWVSGKTGKSGDGKSDNAPSIGDGDGGGD